MSCLKSMIGLVAVGAIAVLAWQVRETRHEVTALADRREAPPTPPAPPQVPPGVRFDAEYVLEAPDIVELTFAVGADPDVVKLLGGKKIISPDGTIGLEPLERLAIAGATVSQAEERVRRHMGVLGVTLKVSSHNSKCYYVVRDFEAGGEKVARRPCFGNETVLDAVASSDPTQKLSAKEAQALKVWVARPMPDRADVILPVDYVAITQLGETGINYQVRHGDRVYVKRVK